MSGIVGVFNLDGAPADGELLERLTDVMRFRGPDERRLWSKGPVGLGFAGFYVFDDGGDRGQPAGLDGKYWIVADARIDAQTELREKLGLAPGLVFTDSELILHSYRRWGRECFAQLVGDFCCILWDENERRLVCARDRTGIKPLFWTRIGNTVIVGNTFASFVHGAELPHTVDQAALRDYLATGWIADERGTFLKGVASLPPASALVCSAGVCEDSRYWVPATADVRRRRDEEHVEEFAALLRQALRDRLRTRRVTLWMSGGLDSTMLAAYARQMPGIEVNAITCVYHPLIADEEELRLCRMAAESLGLELTVQVASAEMILEGLTELPPTPQPLIGPFSGFELLGMRAAALAGRLAMTGFDGDRIIGLPSVTARLRTLAPFAAVDEVGVYLLYEKQLPLLRMLGRWLRPAEARAQCFEQHFAPGGASGWDPPSLEDTERAAEAWPLDAAPWRAVTLSHDAGVWPVPIDSVHPCADFRLIEFCRTLPPVPWRVQKRIIREAVRGLLPDPIRTRPKTPLPGDPVWAAFAQIPGLQLSVKDWEPALRDLLDIERVERAALHPEEKSTWPLMRIYLAQSCFEGWRVPK